MVSLCRFNDGDVLVPKCAPFLVECTLELGGDGRSRCSTSHDEDLRVRRGMTDARGDRPGLDDSGSAGGEHAE